MKFSEYRKTKAYREYLEGLALLFIVLVSLWAVPPLIFLAGAALS